MKIKYGGIDGGSSGAMAFVDENGAWETHLVEIIYDRGHWLLDVKKNLAILRSIADSAGGIDHLMIAYEQSRKNPDFGVKNAHVNGRNEEFWRVTLEGHDFSYCSVDPKTWQCACLKDIPIVDTKERAREYIRQRCPGTGDWLDSLNKAPRKAIVDAMCIALWCRDKYRNVEVNHSAFVAIAA